MIPFKILHCKQFFLLSINEQKKPNSNFLLIEKKNGNSKMKFFLQIKKKM